MRKSNDGFFRHRVVLAGFQPATSLSFVVMDLLYVQPCLCDTFGSPYDEGNDQIFSVLGIDMLEATSADDPTDEDLKFAALKTLANEITSFKLDHKFKFDSLENTNFRES